MYIKQMTNILDKSVVDFVTNNKSLSSTLKKIISAKKKFPTEDFKYLKQAFPCMIASIRDYAEYIPLEESLFDLIIIDEASQVSIAQALPAIIRGKKIVVLGDKKQFSNIQSAHAKTEINQQYLHGIKSIFQGNGLTEAQKTRLKMFNIKTSLLDFFEHIANYHVMLRKHFRGYRELISCSNKFFYKNQLQVMKIRLTPIHEILQFIHIEHDGKQEIIENTNMLEINKIIDFLENFVASDSPYTIGIITPHTKQEELIRTTLGTHRLWNTLREKHKIKIMTFDTCQGEERDIILYSMVASAVSDKLRYIFAKDIENIDPDEETQIKAQRINVGLSRAKEKMVFFLSKPITDFTGSIGHVLNHYQNTLDNAINLPNIHEVDSKSPMEKNVLEWLQETHFFKEHMNSIELKAQFPIGEYLKQLDPYYSHPKYVCDFLLICSNSKDKETCVIIEYDGFKEHFTNLSEVNEFNYEHYYKSDDVFRQKILEGYGYKFLRINRFNIGKNPIEMLDKRLKKLIGPITAKPQQPINLKSSILESKLSKPISPNVPSRPQLPPIIKTEIPPPLPKKTRFEVNITYVNINDEKKTFHILIKNISPRPQGSYWIKAYCYKETKDLNFLASRIQELTDVDTGETFMDAHSFLQKNHLINF